LILSQIFLECKNQWSQAIKEKTHPFKSFVLSTVDHKNRPNSRNVILRGFDIKNLNFTIYADLRSNKINDLKKSVAVQLLFYNYEDSNQIIVQSELIDINTDLNIFNHLSEHSKKNYTSLDPPGKTIDDPYNIVIGKAINFCQLTFKALSIEVLQLKREANIRSCFKLSNDWNGFFMVP